MTEPYYQDESIRLYHGDCLEIDAWLEADVLVTDPPYGTQLMSDDNGNAGGYGRCSRAERKSASMGYGRRQNSLGPGTVNHGRHGCMIAGDDGTRCRDAMLELWGVKPALVFGSPRMPDPPIDVADRLVWDKKRPGMNGGPWRYRHESIYVTAGFVRTSDAAVSILTAFPEQADHIHGKPLALMVELVGAAPGGVIADPFAGSGTTLVAAKRLGRRCVGVEIDERYCEVAAKRLSQGVLNFGAAV